MRPLDEYIKRQLNEHATRIAEILDANVMAIWADIFPGLDQLVRLAVEKFEDREDSLAIVLQTPGGVVEVVERMVDTIRHHYNEVIFIIPDVAMSAGTVFVMSGDRILMDYFSRLGPIDPQIVKDGKLVPALSYLNQFNRLNEKAEQQSLTTAEYALLEKLDLGELYQFEQAKALSKDLLIRWLMNYKFKDWTTTETREIEVTPQMKQDRAEEIADRLSDTEYWHSHGRAISMKTLQEDLNLKIEDYTTIGELGVAVREYAELLSDYVFREQLRAFVHTREYFI